LLLTQPDIQPKRAAGDASQRGPGWFGGFAVLAALTSALATFLILAGLTPILPTHDVVVRVLLTNAVLVLLLVSVVAWQTWRLIRERRAGAAGAGLHVRIVGLFSLVAVLPAILVAVVATVTLERGLDPWFTGSIKELMNNTVGIARAYRETSAGRSPARRSSWPGPQPRQGALRRRPARVPRLSWPRARSSSASPSP
jgi:two-component system nitrogen regulation sensor histidine kinase NtrY